MPRPLLERRVALLAGLGAAAVVGSALLFRRDVALQYYCYRLDHAGTLEEARPWLEKVVRETERPRVAAVLVAKLGPERQKLTFWILHHLKEVSDDPQDDHFFPLRLGELLPMIRGLESRIGRDEKLLSLLAHFVRWCGPERWQILDELSTKVPPGQGLGELLLGRIFSWVIRDLDFSKEILDSARREPQALEAGFRLLNLQLFAEAWIFGMSPLPKFPEFRMPANKEDLDATEFNLAEQIKIWLRDRKGRLTFDPQQGRCVERREGEAFVPVTIPENALPGWDGPPPEDSHGSFSYTLLLPR